MLKFRPARPTLMPARGRLLPVDENGRLQIEAGHAVMLPFTSPVAQLALTMEVNSPENRSSVVNVGFCPLPQTTPISPLQTYESRVNPPAWARRVL